MQIIQTLILVAFFICCACLIFLILIQSGKGGSMGIMGGGGSNTAFGSSTVDVVEKAAFYFSIGFFVLAILAAIAFADTGPKLDANDPKSDTSKMTDKPLDQGQNPAAGQTNPAPGQGNVPAQQPAQP